MTKILVVITTGFELYGGLTSVMLNYWRAMNKEKLHFDFASTNEPSTKLYNEIETAGSKYFKLPARKTLLKYFFELKKLCKNYDVIHVHSNSSTAVLELMAAKLARVKKRIVHNHNSVTSHPILNKILHPFFIRSYTYPIACSKLAGDWLFGEGNYKILKNAINIEKFSCFYQYREEYRKNFNIDEDTIVIGHVGKFNKQKNYPFLINVFEKYHNQNSKSRLLLIGSGQLEKEVKSLVKSKNLDDVTIFAGRRIDIPQMMSAMDVFLFPSLWEGLPLSALEAQASGLPSIISDAISNEVCISDNVHVCKLIDTFEVWANTIDSLTISDRTQQVINNEKQLTKAGYNIKVEANTLRQIYLE